MKIYNEEVKKENFDNYSFTELKKMVGYVEPVRNNKWEVTTIDGGTFVCETPECAFIMAGIEEIKAKLFR